MIHPSSSARDERQKATATARNVSTAIRQVMSSSYSLFLTKSSSIGYTLFGTTRVRTSVTLARPPG